jgi:hypothetical protein
MSFRVNLSHKFSNPLEPKRRENFTPLKSEESDQEESSEQMPLLDRGKRVNSTGFSTRETSEYGNKGDWY